jgi:hypothetical protein
MTPNPMRVFAQPYRTRGHGIQRRAARFIHFGSNPRLRTSRGVR